MIDLFSSVSGTLPTNVSRYRLSKYSLPNEDSYRHVVDATMISDTVIVAYGGGPTQISLLHLAEVRINCQEPRQQ